MTFVSCSIPEQFVNPLFEVFDGGDFVLSSYRDIEEDFTRVRIYFEDPAQVASAKQCLQAALGIVGVATTIETGDIPDEDWKFAYRRHFKTEHIGRRLVIVPEWELESFQNAQRATSGSRLDRRQAVVLDPGMAFGTGKHETTRACLEYVDELLGADGAPQSFLDMGCGSGILSIAAAKLGCPLVKGFDVDQEAVDASNENAEKNGVSVGYVKFALGRASGAQVPVPGPASYALVAANILGPLLIRFADEIVPYVADKIIVSGILTELYPEVLAAYGARGLKEISRKTIGEWTTGLLAR